jgi:hypothetical protein
VLIFAPSLTIKTKKIMNPFFHSKSSVKRWGGKVEDYIQLHELLDSPKATINNNSARLLTHNTWFVYTIIPKIFGYNIINSDGKSVDTIDIAMLHLAEDFRFKGIPTPQDYLENLVVQPWMNNGVKEIPSVEAQKRSRELLEKLRLEKEEI